MSVLIAPGEGHHLGGTFDVVVRVRAEHTGGVMAVTEEAIPPGARNCADVTGCHSRNARHRPGRCRLKYRS
jgi:hypothetical protein